MNIDLLGKPGVMSSLQCHCWAHCY